MFGYKAQIITGRLEWDDYDCETTYLDMDKHPLPKNFIVWESADAK